MKKPRKKTISVSLTSETIEKLKELSSKYYRSISGTVECLIVREFENEK